MKRKNTTATTTVPVVELQPVVPEPTTLQLLEGFQTMTAVRRLELADRIRREATSEIKDQTSKLETELSTLRKLLGETPRNPTALPMPPTSDGGGGVSDKILSALNGGPKTIKELQAATGSKWLNVVISRLLGNKQIVSDGKRPATYSLKG